MSRSLSTALALILSLATAGAKPAQAAEPPDSSNDALKSGIARLERAEYSQALKDFDLALDRYANAQRLEDAKRSYMHLFVINRNHANVLMKAMNAWLEKRRSDSGAVTPAALAAFDSWVKERDALATATINLVHNSPDWK